MTNPFLRILLFPFALLYGLVVAIRNFLFDHNYFKSFEFSDVKIISVGNLTVGGTGKTPHVEYLIRMLVDKYSIATLSRGYGRQTRGFLLADHTSTAASIGDEPMLYHLKFGDKVPVAVGEERLLAIPSIKAHYPQTQVILLDDAFQHRWVKPNLNILLTDYSRPFYDDFLLPSGRLRESRAGSRRADVIIVSKCPDQISEEEKKRIKKQISQHVGKSKPIFFTGISYGQPTSMFDNHLEMNERVVLVSGIAQPKPLVDYVSGKYQLVRHENYADHHTYTRTDVDDMVKLLQWNPNTSLLMTEKDMVKLKEKNLAERLSKFPVYYLPIEIFFHEKWGGFDAIVTKTIIDKE